MKQLYEMKSEFIECDCGNELLQLTHDEPEMVGDFVMDFIYMSFYQYGSYRDNRFSFKRRIQHIWHILRYGTPWQDQIILRTNERLKLMKWLYNVEEIRLKKEREKNESLPI